ncbi:MAG TPA: hypothetical protein VG838_00485 [Opitutaceae bacterium]|nr:hypothetical protein [Opitutaceae bacterium]
MNRISLEQSRTAISNLYRATRKAPLPADSHDLMSASSAALTTLCDSVQKERDDFDALKATMPEPGTQPEVTLARLRLETLAKLATQLCAAIEALPPSEQQTALSTQAAELRTNLSQILNPS